MIDQTVDAEKQSHRHTQEHSFLAFGKKIQAGAQLCQQGAQLEFQLAVVPIMLRG